MALPTGNRRRPSRTRATPRPMLVWVLVPTVETDDPNLACYTDFSQSLDEFTRAFDLLAISWKWQPVTLATVDAVLEAIADDAETDHLIFNLCDGDAVNGVPGLSVIHTLDRLGLPYTGADAAFYDVTTSKITMKRLFDVADVPTAPWAIVNDDTVHADLFARCGSPLLVKPAVSAGSMGITTASVVDSDAALRAQVAELRQGYRGWDLAGGGILVERFVSGREFTAFIVGSASMPTGRMIYPAVERVFHHSLPDTERFLSFDRLWEIYERETPIGPSEYLWEYAGVDEALDARIADVSWAAYVAVGGRGYGRVDLRLDEETDELIVLEVNAQCGLSEDENYTSIGAILRVSQLGFADVVQQIVANARAHAGAVRPVTGGAAVQRA
jgi:D-alanine-D-alanine ligase